MEHTNKLARSVLSFTGGEGRTPCCATLLGGKAGNTQFEVHTFRVAVCSMSKIWRFSRSKMFRYSQEPQTPTFAGWLVKDR